MASSSGERYYLDTSAQLERHGGIPERRDQLKAMLAGGGHATSSQVLREWNRIVFDACVALRQALSQGKTWADVSALLRQGYGRKPVHRWMVAEWITEGKNREDLRTIEMLTHDFQRVRARAMFRVGVSEVRDATDCPIARERPHPSPKGWVYKSRCKKTESICAQPDFLGANMSRAREAATALTASPRSDDAKMGREALGALDKIDQGGTKGNACHAARGLGGDIGIALECDSAEVLLTTDESFDFICPALRLSHIRIT